MEYIEVKVYGTTVGLDIVAAVLTDYGIDGIAIEDPADIAGLLACKDEYNWDYFDEALSVGEGASGVKEAVASFYIENNAEGAAVFEVIQAEIARIGANAGVQREAGGTGGSASNNHGNDSHNGSRPRLGSLRVESCVRLDDEWKDSWKEFFKPKRITGRLVVKPGWEDWNAKEGDIVIEIDPGMAFGTGHHETTTLCARLLEENVTPGCSVFDVGCGSGILSIAAAMLGAGEVLAVDIDEIAVDVSRENAAVNGCCDRVKVICADLNDDIDFKADIVAANLTADLIIKLANKIKSNLKPGGVFAASGILAERGECTSRAISEAGFEIRQFLVAGEWCAIEALAI
ncbi:MAG: 50S ribosomal protein L11 methyltransferase [Clostridiales Family XIII bacterium]|nr:50S ribosomal protein L11 methyltransferase [Clostridiales Family XIII bacterium]